MADGVLDFGERLRAGGRDLNITALVPHSFLIETMARAGYSSVTLDVQHGFFDYDGVLVGIAAAAGVGAATVVRVAHDDLAMAARCLDAGAAGVLVPMVETAEHARRVVAATKYPPVGQRSWGPNRALALSGLSPSDFLARANRLSFVFAMIETEMALANVEAIAATEGIDGLFVGPLDLGISLSAGRVLDSAQAAVVHGLDLVAAACRNHGKTAGTYAPTAEQARLCLDRGYRFLTLGHDTGFIEAGARAALRQVTGET